MLEKKTFTLNLKGKDLIFRELLIRDVIALENVDESNIDGVISTAYIILENKNLFKDKADFTEFIKNLNTKEFEKLNDILAEALHNKTLEPLQPLNSLSPKKKKIVRNLLINLTISTTFLIGAWSVLNFVLKALLKII